MANRVYAKEWLTFAYKNLLTAQHLYDVEHFTDIIIIDLQQALEKTLKALLAYQNLKIPKSHYLDELSSLTELISFTDDDLTLLERTTDFYKDDRYPNPNYTLPTLEETSLTLEFTNELFDKVCLKLNISKEELLNVE